LAVVGAFWRAHLQNAITYETVPVERGAWLGHPMTTLNRLRSALKAPPPGAPVALHLQRDQKLLFLTFTLNQP
jgi:hypothetical protein